MDDRAQIENMLARYREYYDQGNLEEYSQLFKHGRTISPDGSLREGAEAVRKHHEELAHFYDGKPNTAHVISNIRIEIDD